MSQSNIPQEDEKVQDYLEKIYLDLFEMEKQLETLAHNLKNDSSEERLNAYANLQHRFEENGGYTYKSEMMTVIYPIWFY